MKKNITCICCPLGCQLDIDIENEEILQVSNNKCKRGDTYARKELTNPTRVVTTTVCIKGGDINMLPVKTNGDIPIKMVFSCVSHIKNTVVNAPVKVGDIVVKNILNTGVDIVATRNVKT